MRFGPSYYCKWSWLKWKFLDHDWKFFEINRYDKNTKIVRCDRCGALDLRWR